MTLLKSRSRGYNQGALLLTCPDSLIHAGTSILGFKIISIHIVSNPQNSDLAEPKEQNHILKLFFITYFLQLLNFLKIPLILQLLTTV